MGSNAQGEAILLVKRLSVVRRRDRKTTCHTMLMFAAQLLLCLRLVAVVTATSSTLWCPHIAVAGKSTCRVHRHIIPLVACHFNLSSFSWI